MRIYDISRGLFETEVYPGDPSVTAAPWYSMAKGDICNLHALSLGTHAGTHLDAPLHFLAGGKGVSEIELERCVGECQVVESMAETLDASEMAQILPIGCTRLLVRGEGVLTEEGASFLVRQGVKLFGTGQCTVGNSVTSPQVHKTLLEAELLILENLNLEGVPVGGYLLCAQPLKLEGMDGSPVRAILLDLRSAGGEALR